jgi:hypothetical protein
MENKTYKAQIIFKHDYQDSGIFLESYSKNKTVNKVRFSNNGLAIMNIGERGWINENSIRIYYVTGYTKSRRYYWEISITGTVCFENTNNNDPQELYNLRIMYYEGWGIIKNEEEKE